MQETAILTASQEPQTGAAITAVVRTLPQLTSFGMGLYANGAGLSVVEYAHHFRAKQAALLADVEAFAAVCAWLETILPRQTMSYGSYYLKHVCERALGQYVSNGVFIAAAVHCGFPYQLLPGSPNVRFGMSKRSIRAAARRVPTGHHDGLHIHAEETP